MWRFLADENFNADIVRGLKLRGPTIDLITVRDAGLAGADDRDVLAWASENDRTVLTHDRATMPRFAFERTPQAQETVLVFVINDRTPVGTAISELLLVVSLCGREEFGSPVVYVPIR